MGIRMTVRALGCFGAWAALACWIAVPGQAQLKPELDLKIPPYTPASAVSGSLVVAGSETMRPFTQGWANELGRLYPGVTIKVEGLGSETGPVKLLERKAEIAAMSRRMTTQEIADFMQEFGYEPTEVPVGVDALAVFVHRENPIAGITLQELDAIFCLERRRGIKYPIDSWGLLGLDEDWFDAPIRSYGRDGLSGTAAFFKEQVCDGAELKPGMIKSPGSASVVMDVSHDRLGIGFSGIGYRTSGVRPVPLAKAKGGRYVEPTFQTAIDGTYPLRRTFYLYVNKSPKAAPSPLVAEFVKFALSRQGQELVIKTGYFPLTASEITRLLAFWSVPVNAASAARTPSLRN